VREGDLEEETETLKKGGRELSWDINGEANLREKHAWDDQEGMCDAGRDK